MISDIPICWAAELKAAYPRRSGPTGWASMKLLLACRRALMESTWQEIIDGCERYKAYCIQSGREGTDFVQNPLRFIEDGCYLEDFTYQAPQTKEEAARADHERKSNERMDTARTVGSRLTPPLSPDPGECVAAFETRIRMAQSNPPAIPGDIRRRISSLMDRQRVTK